MVANPEEGRLSSEDQAEQLRQARKQTTQMKRQYRDMRREKDAEAKAQRWAERHKAVHEDTYDDLEKISGGGRPLNRAGRRKFAKKMNGKFEVKGGFMEGKVLPMADIDEIAQLPGKDALYSKVLGTMLAPITSLAVVLGQILEQKGGSLETAEAAAD